MKSLIGFFVCLFALLAAACSSQKNLVPSHAVTYSTPGIEQLNTSEIYQVWVDQKPLQVFESKPPTERLCLTLGCDGADTARQQKRTMAWTNFSFEHKAKIKVVKQKFAGSLTDIIVRPKSGLNRDYKIVSKDLAKAEIVVEVINTNSKISIEYIDDRYLAFRQIPLDGLMIFADQLETKDISKQPNQLDPKTYVVEYGAEFNFEQASQSSRVYFAPGVHHLGYWEIPEAVKHVYLAGGAYVLGALNSAVPAKRFQKGFTVSGRGVISGEHFPWRADKRKKGLEPCVNDKGEAVDCWFNTVKLLQLGTDKYLLEGITFVNAPSYVITGFTDGDIAWNANDGEGNSQAHKDPLKNALYTEELLYSGMLSNFKVLGNWRWNGDGAAIHANSRIQDCFISPFDDAFKTYSSNGTVEDCVIWQTDNGAVFQFGWYPKTVSGLKVNNLDIIHAEWTGRNQNWGIFNFADRGYASGSKNILKVIKDSSFSNIRAEGPVARIIGLENQVVKNQAFENLLFENIWVEHLLTDEEAKVLVEQGNGIIEMESLDWSGNPVGRPANMINDSGDIGYIKNIQFKNLVINKTKITNENAKTLGQFTIKTQGKQVYFK
ncbi:hypothetical protein [Catenovulum maritimum]|nr:hypothetical protein [Catenovulum maritimum]